MDSHLRQTSRCLVYWLLSCLWVVQAMGDPVISEFMADNTSYLKDEDGDYSDWIEIHNPTAQSLNLVGWSLTDKASDLTQWRFPAVTLAPGEFLVVWASGKNRKAIGQPLHTNFSLSKAGEYLGLVKPDGQTVVQEYAPYPVMEPNESYGRQFTTATLVGAGASGRYLVPPDDSLGLGWTAKNFGDGTWSSGATGMGYGLLEPGISVRQVQPGSFGGVGNLAQTDGLLGLATNDAGIAAQAAETVLTLNYLGEGSDGHYAGNRVLPLGAAQSYAIKATGYVRIPTAGIYTFGLNSDDGGRIRIDGVNVMEDDTGHGAEDHLGAVTLTQGLHTFEVVMWEGGGGDELEFYAGAGNFTSWQSSFALVGDAANGGLEAFTVPASGGGAVQATDLSDGMQNLRTSCYVRLPFISTGVSGFSSMSLKMRYDDGYVAYLNGTKIGARNAPGVPNGNSAATANHSADALIAESINVTEFMPLLANGNNLLAVHGLNQNASDSTFLVLPELVVGSLQSNAPSVVFDASKATPGAINGSYSLQGRVQAVKWSTKPGFFTESFTLTLSTTTPSATIRYTTDGSVPTLSNGRTYVAPLTVGVTTVLRVAGFKSAFESSEIQTGTFIFVGDVINQSPTGTRPTTAWPLPNSNEPNISYGMDPQVVKSTDPQVGGPAALKSALLSLPTLSIVTELPGLFNGQTGILFNPYGRGFSWERPASFELINPPSEGKPNGSAELQVNCGIRVRGGYSRSPSNPKHGIHVYFRSDYGAGKLKYPLFGRNGAQEFDQIDLRTAENYSWSFAGDGSNTFLREESSRRAQLEMGQPASHVKYVHLYINGHYWGLFDFDERTEAFFGESYFGGKKSDFDVVKCEQDSGYTIGATDGDLSAWNALWTLARAHAASPTNANYFKMQGRAADGVTPTADPVLLDVDNLIDYMMLTFWTGNEDGSTSSFLGNATSNNWFGMRDRTGSRGFAFFAHDFEHSLGVPAGPFNDRTGPFISPNQANFDYSSPMFLHQDLMGNLEYRIRWADRVQKHMFNTGALTAGKWTERLMEMSNTIDGAIRAESARWGDSKSANPFTHLDWQNARDYLVNQYVPSRGATVLQQLRDDGLYPSIDGPTVAPFGGYVALGSEVTMSAPSGAIYYMADGSDPRELGGALKAGALTYVSQTTETTLIAAGALWKYLDDGSNQGTAWQTAGFDDSGWSSGPAEFGYGDGSEGTVINGGPLNARFATTYFRKTFNVASLTGITSLQLSLKYDDQAWVYVNGQLALKTDANLTNQPAYDFYTVSTAPDEANFLPFSLNPALLVSGTNTIAVEIHQASAGSSDVSFDLSLKTVQTNASTPLLLNVAGEKVLRVRALDGTTWSALTEAAFLVDAQAASRNNLAIVEIMASPNEPSVAEAAAGFKREDFQFVVLQNFSTGTIDLRGLYLDGGIEFDFSKSLQPRTLGPGGRIILVSSLAGFETRYGTGLPVAGKFSGELNDSGETIFIHTADEAVLRQVTYKTNGGWPNATEGYSLVWQNASGTAGADDVPANWTLSVNAGGNLLNPGAGAGILQWSASEFSGKEDSGKIQVRVFRTGSTSNPASVAYTTSDGTALAASDYTAATGTIQFLAGQASATLNLIVSKDFVREEDESFTVTLSGVTGAASLGTQSVTTAWIENDDDPSNDDFSGAQILTGSTGTVSGSNLGADLEPGEPMHGGVGGRSIWYAWTAPATGIATFDTLGSLDAQTGPLDTLLAAYTGAGLGTLIQRAANDDDAGLVSRIRFPVAAGTKYWIAVDGKNRAKGAITLNWNLQFGGTVEFSQASYEIKEGAGVATLTVMRTGSNASAVDVDYLLSDGTAIAGDDYQAASGSLHFAVGQVAKTLSVTVLNDTELESAESLTITLSNVSAAAELGGNTVATLTISDDEDDPTNDAFADSVELFGDNGVQAGSNVGAGLQTGEPSGIGGASVWYRWMAPANGVATFDTVGSVDGTSDPLDTVLTIYTGSSLAALKQVATNDDHEGLVTSEATFVARAGTVYHVAVRSKVGTSGSLLLNWDLVDAGTLFERSSGFRSPKIRVSEKYRETLKGTTVSNSEDLVVGVSASMAAIGLSAINASTPFHLKIGAFSLSGTLADDPNYLPGKRSASFALKSGAVVVGSLRLVWSAKLLTATLISKSIDYTVASQSYLNQSAAIQKVLQPAEVEFGFAGNTGSRYVYLAGRAELTTKTVSAQNFQLSSVTLSGGGDFGGPRVTIQTSNRATRTESSTVDLSGTIADGVKLASVSLTLDGQTVSGLVSNFESGNKAGTWSVSGVALVAGPNHFEIVVEDESGNRVSRQLVVTRVVMSLMTVDISGQGTVSGGFDDQMLEIGKLYRIGVLPAKGWLFESWSGGVQSINPSLIFTMSAGLSLQANFVVDRFADARGHYRGLIRPGALELNQVGALDVTATAGGALSGKLQIGSQSITLTGKFRPNGTYQRTVLRPGLPPLVITLALDLINQTGQITGTISDGTFSSDISADRQGFDGKTSVANQAGRFSLRLEPSAPLTGVPGTGYATVTISTSGLVRLAGALADGTTLSGGGAISQDGVYPIYLPLYQKAGVLMGALLFNSQSASGDLEWRRPAVGAQTQIEAILEVSGSRYSPPVQARVLSGLNASAGVGSLELSSPDLGSLTRSFTLSLENQVSFSSTSPDLKLSLKIDSATGFFSGNFNAPGQTPPRKFFGIIDQSAQEGVGFFLSPTGHGSVSFGP